MSTPTPTPTPINSLWNASGNPTGSLTLIPFANQTETVSPTICEPGGRGFIFPLLESEQHWPTLLRGILYSLALCYIFYGVSIAADKFMEGIFTITSKKVRTKTRDGRTQTTLRWNKTVANLTLMALGSSGPEIILSIVEVVGNEFHSGVLGPSTIVGSAAFNLFVIIAVCIQAVPFPEVRSIKEYNVFIITAVFSIIAYLWLLFIVQISSPDVITPLEAIITLLLFPVLTIISYLADIGYFSAGGERASKYDGTPLNLHAGQQASTSGNLTRASTWPPPWKICRNPSRPWKISSAAINSNVVRSISAVRSPSGKLMVNKHGIFCFRADSMDVMGGSHQRDIQVSVWRRNGSAGIVSCRYRTEANTAIQGRDYEDASGCLTFYDGEDLQEITIKILPKKRWEQEDSFRIILEDATGGAIFNPNDDGGKDSCILTVTIQNEAPETVMTYVDKAINVDQTCLGISQWKEDIVASVANIEVEDDEDDEDEKARPTSFDTFLHVISIPWKLPMAIVIPPPILCGGWLCFVLAITVIGGLTLLIIDFAELFGCVTGVPDSITAITFVALGTSMPDLFASKTAAVQDETADASIVNVTGSNSVNVFLGIGIPWTIAAFYWASVPPTELWLSKYSADFGTEGAFVVIGGDLGFSVIVFIISAFLALAVLRLRRTYFQGELGGAPGPKSMTAVLFVMLWLFYIVLSIWKVFDQEADFAMQLIAIGIALLVLEHVVLACGCIMYALGGFSKDADDDSEKDLEAFPGAHHTHQKPLPSTPSTDFTVRHPFTGVNPTANRVTEPLRSDGIHLRFDDDPPCISIHAAGLACLAIVKLKRIRDIRLAQRGRRIEAGRRTRSGDLQSQFHRPVFPDRDAPGQLASQALTRQHTHRPPQPTNFGHRAGSSAQEAQFVDLRPFKFSKFAAACLAVVKFKRLRSARQYVRFDAVPSQSHQGRFPVSGQRLAFAGSHTGQDTPPPLPPPSYSPEPSQTSSFA